MSYAEQKTYVGLRLWSLFKSSIYPGYDSAWLLHARGAPTIFGCELRECNPNEEVARLWVQVSKQAAAVEMDRLDQIGPRIYPALLDSNHLFCSRLLACSS